MARQKIYIFTKSKYGTHVTQKNYGLATNKCHVNCMTRMACQKFFYGTHGTSKILWHAKICIARMVRQKPNGTYDTHFLGEVKKRFCFRKSGRVKIFADTFTRYPDFFLNNNCGS